MELSDLYDEIERNNISVYNWKMIRKARIIDYGCTAIFVDYSQIHTYVEEKEVVAEELGHFLTGSLYDFQSDKSFVDRQEFKAKKWKAIHLCPRQSILSCFKKGITNYFDIAQELQIDPFTLEFAIQYYKEQK